MRLRRDINLAAFIQAATNCQKDVLYQTAEGDCLNLKSTLSRFIFLSVIDAYPNLSSGSVAYNEIDFPLLQEFLEEEMR